MFKKLIGVAVSGLALIGGFGCGGRGQEAEIQQLRTRQEEGRSLSRRERELLEEAQQEAAEAAAQAEQSQDRQR